jgi:hypothetical protein
MEVMEVIADPEKWAEQTFGKADLGDKRRARRLVSAAAKIAAHPEISFTQVFDWNELRGFYRLCDQTQATLAAVQEPHWQQTRAAMRKHPLVLIVHDTTELDFSSHRHLTGAGQIGNENGKGFLQYNSLAIVPKPQQVLGLAYQQLITRQPAPVGENTTKRKQWNRESQLWQFGFRAAGHPPTGCTWVDVCDRGSDDYEAMRTSSETGHDFLIRVAQNRIVFLSADADEKVYLLDYARSLKSMGSDEVEIPGRGGRAGRKAVVQMASAPVWLPPPSGTRQRSSQPVIVAWVIRIWEADPPAGIDEPVEWVLISSMRSQTLEELKERRDWYCCRWLIEVYHNIEKNGCSEEDRRFETADRMATCLAILAVVAVRVFQLRCALDHQPEQPAEQVATAQEIKVMRAFLKHKGKQFTVKEFVRGVAKLGGFLGRKNDGDPGVRALWQGYQRLQDMLQGILLLASVDSA